jgi:gluconate 2-dehydrogenase subunit 3-like protein
VDEIKLKILSGRQGSFTDSAQLGSLTRREIMQRLLAGAGASIASSAFAAAHPLRRHLTDPAIFEHANAKAATPDWKPEFLNAEQDQALMAIAERMLPGSAQAQVSRIIDLLLTVDTANDQKSFLASLAALNREANQQHGKEFSELAPQQQDAVLTTCAGGKESASSTGAKDPDEIGAAKVPVTLRDHFENLKGWVVGAYYATEQGMRELGWTEDFYFEELPTCQHGQEHSADANTATGAIVEGPLRAPQDGF